MPPTFVFAQDAPAGNGVTTLAFYGILAAAFWFLFVRPQRKRQSAAREVQASLEVGAEVRTIGGIHGRIVEADETSVVLELESGRMRIERRGVSAQVAQDD